MTALLRVHASPDPPALDRVRARLAAFSDVGAIVVVPGELVGDTVEVEVSGDPSPMREGEIRAAVLEAIEAPDRAETVEAAIVRLEAELATLRERIDAVPNLQVIATRKDATPGP